MPIVMATGGREAITRMVASRTTVRSENAERPSTTAIASTDQASHRNRSRSTPSTRR